MRSRPLPPREPFRSGAPGRRGRGALRWIGAAVALLACLAPPRAQAADGAGPEAARAELAELAPRIERMKQEVAAGRLAADGLEPLLARAQALAARIEAAGRAPPPPARKADPDAQELREQADALRDQADRTAAALAGVERQLEQVARRAHLGERLEALGASSDLFAEGVPGRARSGGSAAGTTAPGGVPDGQTSGPGGSSGSAGPPTSLRAASEHGPIGGGGAADPEPLRQRQEALRRELSGLRARIDALEAAARAAR